MTAVVAAWLALATYMLGLVWAFGLRTLRHLQWTGSHGFRGISGRPGSPAWWGGVLFVLALVLGLAATVLAALGVVRGLPALTHPAIAVVGLLVAVAGLVVTLLAQSAMGASWRIGVDETERTELVERGLFRWVRNPVFTGMCLVPVGVALLSPTVLAIVSAAVLVIAVQIQVRVTEEPYLRQVHGATYEEYRSRTGRFLPRLSARGGRGRSPQPDHSDTG